MRAVWGAILLGIALSSGCSSERAPGSVLLITIDTLRADHLSGAGYVRPTSPTLDAFARRGTRFEWAFSTCSYTVPSHTSMLVGRYPSFHSAGLLNGQQRLLPSETTLAEILRDAGWRTAAIVSNAVLDHGVGLAQGFESYDDDLPDRELVRRLRERRAANAVDRALEKLAEFGEEPYFLWLHLQDPHGPYTPPATIPGFGETGEGPSDSRTLPVGGDFSGYRAIPAYQVVGSERRFGDYRERYDREIRSLDRELARLFARLDESVERGRVLVVITGDHGEAMGEDGFYFSHGHSVGLDQVHVPLIFVGGDVATDRSIATPVTNMSVFATILEYLGQPLPERVQAPALLATLVAGAEVPEGPVYTESHTQRGIAAAGHYLRRDRRPVTDEAFWQTSPISDGTIVPLGTTLSRLGEWGESGDRLSTSGARGETLDPGVDPLTNERADAERIGAALGKRLDAFARGAEGALEFRRRRARPRELDPSLNDELRALGYGR